VAFGPIWHFMDFLCPCSQAEANSVTRLSQTDAGTSPVSRPGRADRCRRRWRRSTAGQPGCLTPRQGALAGAWPTSIRSGRVSGGPDGSGHGLLEKFLCQFADLGFGIAAVAAERLEEGQLALLGPADTVLGETYSRSVTWAVRR
jgi:hypothetical protein